jgi:dynein heavy chain
MREKMAAEADLAVARPFLEEANSALDNINAQDIVELKALQKPADIIKLVFDVVMLLMKQPMQRVTPGALVLGVGRTKQSVEFLADSYALAKVLLLGQRVWHRRSPASFVFHCLFIDFFQRGLLSDMNFLKVLTRFADREKDNLNDETIELIAPYLEIEEFDPFVARNASRAGTGPSPMLD